MPPRNFRLRNTTSAKTAPAKAEAESAVEKDASNPDTFFPYIPYISATGVHACLAAFTALFLPRTTLSLLINLNPFQSQNSADDGHPTTAPDALYLLTNSPLRTVAWLCVGMVVLQAWWASWLRKWLYDTRALKVGEDEAADVTKQKLERRLLDRQQLDAFKNAAVATSVASVAFHAIIVLFGAPMASHSTHTYSLALLLALLTVWTPAYALGAPTLGSSTEALLIRLTWIRLFAEIRPRTAIERAMVYPAIGAMLGCWSGAIPIGLDWDRPWQAWPLTPAYGAMSGYVLGSFAAVVVSGVTHLARTDILSRARQLTTKKQPKIRQR